jgi:hypothetical protein
MRRKNVHVGQKKFCRGFTGPKRERRGYSTTRVKVKMEAKYSLGSSRAELRELSL